MFRARGCRTNFVPAAIPLSASVSAVMWVPLVLCSSKGVQRPTFGLGWTQASRHLVRSCESDFLTFGSGGHVIGTRLPYPALWIS